MFKNKWIDKALFQTIGMVHQKNIYIMEPRKIVIWYIIEVQLEQFQLEQFVQLEHMTSTL